MKNADIPKKALSLQIFKTNKCMEKANKETIYDYGEGDLVDLYFYGELLKAKTPIIRIVDYGNGLVRYQVLDFLVTSNNLKKSK